MRNERGFALIAALWLLVVLSAIGLEFSLQARQRRLAAINVVDEARARAAAEAGLEHVRARMEALLQRAERLQGPLAPEQLADPWGRLGSVLPAEVALGDQRYRVALRDVNAALNLNRASEEELRRLFTALRIDFGRADEIAQAVLDWRDEDDLHRPRGAERPYYLRHGSPVLPRNGPFADLSELLHVRGMTPEIYEQVRPYLTLLGTGRVNLNAAEPPVLLALPGMSDEAVAVLLRYRRQGRRLGNLFELGQELSPGAERLLVSQLPRLVSRTTVVTHEVEVRSEGWTEGGQLRSEVEGLLVRGGGSAFLVWRRMR